MAGCSAMKAVVDNRGAWPRAVVEWVAKPQAAVAGGHKVRMHERQETKKAIKGS